MTGKSRKPEHFDFDAWKELAEQDPEAFERKRREAIEAAIAQAPPQMRQRLTGLQWRIEMERSKSRNPTQSFLRIYKMMWQSVYGENGLLDALNGKVAESRLARAPLPEASEAKVVPLRRPSPTTAS